jgi:hypothetical protein
MKNHPDYSGPSPIEERLQLPARTAQIHVYAHEENGPRMERFKWAMEQSGPGELEFCRGHSSFTFRFSGECPSVETVVSNLYKSGLHIQSVCARDGWPDMKYDSQKGGYVLSKWISWPYADVRCDVSRRFDKQNRLIEPDKDLLR